MSKIIVSHETLPSYTMHSKKHTSTRKKRFIREDDEKASTTRKKRIDSDSDDDDKPLAGPRDKKTELKNTTGLKTRVLREDSDDDAPIPTAKKRTVDADWYEAIAKEARRISSAEKAAEKSQTKKAKNEDVHDNFQLTNDLRKSAGRLNKVLEKQSSSSQGTTAYDFSAGVKDKEPWQHLKLATELLAATQNLLALTQSSAFEQKNKENVYQFMQRSVSALANKESNDAIYQIKIWKAEHPHNTNAAALLQRKTIQQTEAFIDTFRLLAISYNKALGDYKPHMRHVRPSKYYRFEEADEDYIGDIELRKVVSKNAFNPKYLIRLAEQLTHLAIACVERMFQNNRNISLDILKDYGDKRFSHLRKLAVELKLFKDGLHRLL